jgi:tetratricopeptide (TPR) repeat protein
MALQKAGHTNDALQNYRKALDIARKSYAETHPKLLHFRKNTALLYEILNQYDNALELWLQNFQAYRDKNGLNHSATQTALTHLINGHRQLGNIEQVEKYQALVN